MTQDELNKVTQDVIAELKKNGTNVADANVVSDISQVNNLVAYGKNGKVIKVTPRTIQESVVKHVAWNDSNRLNDFITAGVYEITGERKMSSEYDNLPIENSGGGHTISARLEVLDSSINNTTNSDDKCITQKLTLSNRVGGDGNVYIRTGRGRTYDSITWENWATLQTNINVGQVESLDEFVDNGIYSGVWTDGSSFSETFVMVVINDYAVSGENKTIVQYKYAYDTINGNGEPTYKTRSLHNGEWRDWEDIGADDIPLATTDNDGLMSAEDKKKFDYTYQTALNLNIKASAIDRTTFTPEENVIKVEFQSVGNVEGEHFKYTDELPAATTEKAGVMTAEDKKALDAVPKNIAKEKTAIVNGDTIAGLAREVYSRTGKVDTATFLKRTTAGGTTISDGVASIKEIGGNIVKNLVDIDWGFGNNIGNWSRMGNTTYTVNGAFINVNFKTTWIGIQSYQNLISSHKYYMAVYGFGNLRNLVLRCGGINAQFRLEGTWRFVSNIFSDLISELNSCSIRSSVVGEATFYNPIFIDLTERFGAGNEPDKNTCDKLFGNMDALPQGLTIAQPTGLKSLGYNQADPEKILRGKDISDRFINDKGEITIGIIDSDSKNIAVIPCLPCKIGEGENNGYVVGYGEGDDWSDEGVAVYFSPLNPMEVDGELYMHKLEKDATYGTYVPQCKGYMLVVTPTIDKLCVNFRWSGDRSMTDYEEYIESNVALPEIPQMSEWGLAGIQSSGTLAADTIDLERMVYTKRIGSVDLGSLSWSAPTEDYPSFLSSVVNDIKSGIYGRINNLICKPFNVVKNYHRTNPFAVENSIWIHGDYTNRLCIQTSKYTDSASIKAALQGVILYYELAEPEEYPIVTKAAPNYIGSDYGVEEFVGSKIPLNANILFYMRSLVGETRNFLDRLYDNTDKTDAKEVADYITSGIESNKELATNAPNLALRALFIAAGAVYNDTDQIIQKTAPWGESVDHLPKHYYLNGLGDITEEQMTVIYNAGRYKGYAGEFFNYSEIRTILPARYNGQEGAGANFNLVTSFNGCTNLEVAFLSSSTNNANTYGISVGTHTNLSNAFLKCEKLRYIQPLSISNCILTNTFYRCTELEIVKLFNLSKDLSFSSSSKISKSSIIHIIQKAVPTSAIAITLHHDAYVRLTADQEVLDVLTEKNEALATKGKGGKISLVCATHSEEITPNA